jgi:hypothetical protein
LSIVDEELKTELQKFYSSENFKDYKFNINELRRIKVDLTFCDVTNTNNKEKEKESPKESMEKAVEFTKSSINSYPEIKPVMKFCKRLLNSNRLNNTFNGIYKLN